MKWMRAGTAALVAGFCALLVACGSGVTSDVNLQPGEQLKSDAPSEQGRIITVGDGFADIGQNGFVFSVNDGSPSWVEQFGLHYGVTVRPDVAGGWAYAQGSARIASADPQYGARSVAQQIDQLLADTQLRRNDFVFINGGMHDIVDAVERYGSAESEQTRNAVDAAAGALVAQVKRLIDAGAGHIMLTGVYDLGTSPWAASWGRSAPRDGGPVTDLTLIFNNRLLTDLVDHGAVLLYLDAAQFYRFAYDDRDGRNYGLVDIDNPACGAVPLAQCTPDQAAANYNGYLFADNLHFAPHIWRAFGSDEFGENAYQRVADRWGTP